MCQRSAAGPSAATERLKTPRANHCGAAQRASHCGAAQLVLTPALTATRTNAERAKLSIRLHQGDAREQRVKNVSLIISNPPMGRRLSRDGNLGPLLDAFLANAAASLVPGGRLVWLSPFADRTASTARRLGLKVTRYDPVDLGGFPAELQRFDR